MREIGLASLAADEQPSGRDVTDDVVADALAALEPEELAPGVVLDMSGEGAVEPLEAHEQPGHATLMKPTGARDLSQMP